MQFEYPFGATPLDANEIEGLIPIHITQQTELNEFEQLNILKAGQWVAAKKFSMDEILDQDFIRRLHLRMFNETWRWAGKLRQTEKNIGVDPVTISIEIKKLIDDVAFQIKNKSYSEEEIATRFHHRLVSIHPFSNGNGRHARLMTDVMVKTLEIPTFSWGAKNLANQEDFRTKYIEALRTADRYDYALLLKFVRS